MSVPTAILNGGPADEDYFLIGDEALRMLKTRVLEELEVAADNGSLIREPDLRRLLYCWMDCNDGDPSEIRAWTASLLNDESALMVLIREFTGETSSFGINPGGLSDRVAVTTPTVVLRDDSDIVDAAEFRNALERLVAAPTSDPANVEKAKSFLDAWDRKPRH